MKALSVLLSVCGVGASVWAAGENLLVNPGFEESTCPSSSNKGEWGWFKDGAVTTKGWKGGGNAGLAKSGSSTWKKTRSGNWTAYLQRYRPWGAGSNSCLEQTVRTPSDGVYEFSCDLAMREGHEAGWLGFSVSDGQTTRECEAIRYSSTDYRRAAWRVTLKGGVDYTLRLHQFDGLEMDTTALVDDCLFTYCGVHVLPKGLATPTIHVTDLFRPYDDPDDHWDLATQFALAKIGAIDLRGVVGDYPSTAVRKRVIQPDITAVAQLSWITGLGVAMGVGQPDWGQPLRSGLALLKRTLEEAKEPVALHVIGSCKDVAEAGSLWPELFKTKVKGIYLNAGSAVETKQLEWNVNLDPKPYATMFKLPCPIYWMPCFDAVGKMGGAHGTWWKFRMSRAFALMRPPVKNFFNGMFAKRNPSDWLTFLDGPVDQAALDKTGRQLRNMWCTAGFLHAGGLTVWKDGTIAKLGEAPEKEVFRFIPVTVVCTDDGHTAWQPTAQAGTRFIFEIVDERAYPEAMVKALAELMFAL